MKFITKLLSLLLIIFSLSINKITAQNIHETIKFADNQYNNANYKLALKEYQRVVFFSNDSINYLYKQIANSFFKLKKYKNAAYYYELCYKTSNNDSVKNEILLQKASCYIITKKFQSALLELINLQDNLSSYFTYRKNFYYAVTYFGIEDYKSSKKYFLKLIHDNQAIKIKELNQIFDKKRNLHRPNPKTAKILSIILPGTGQLYSGNFKSSINSLSLTSLLAFTGISITQYYGIFDAVVAIAPWFLRYYKGGYKNAEKIAYKKRAKKRNTYYKKILQIINNQP